MDRDRIEIKKLSGDELKKSIDALAHLRIEVFHDFPYLYDGTLEYEKRYLDVYLRSERSAMIAAYDGDQIIGAASALPLRDETPEVQAPFKAAGFSTAQIFYFGESVLLKNYRGLGIGHKFFDARENIALSYGEYNITCFCAVDRPANHPLRPENYRPLNEFWQKRGYKICPELKTQFSWRDRGEDHETFKNMIFWIKKWD